PVYLGHEPLKYALDFDLNVERLTDDLTWMPYDDESRRDKHIFRWTCASCPYGSLLHILIIGSRTARVT
ncbi:hypothetical protein LTR43_012463, partial [Exophiala xenobiotica]